jgi:hypothetical protein
MSTNSTGEFLCFGGSLTRFETTTLPQGFMNLCAGCLEALDDPVNPSKTQNKFSPW